MTTKTPEEAAAFKASIGLDPGAKAKLLPAAPKRDVTKRQPVLAPEGVDPRTMPVTEIVFDDALLDDFPSLEGEGLKRAADHVFAFYKSPGRNTERNRPLWSEVGKFIQRVKKSRKAGVPHVKEEVRRTKPQRDLLALLNEMGISSVEDMQALLSKDS